MQWSECYQLLLDQATQGYVVFLSCTMYLVASLMPRNPISGVRDPTISKKMLYIIYESELTVMTIRKRIIAIHRVLLRSTVTMKNKGDLA